MTAQRYRPRGVIPLELWDVLIDDQPLYLLPEREQPAAVARLTQQLRAGTARRKRGAVLPKLAVDEVVLAGGGPLSQIAAEIARTGLCARVHDDPLWISEAGGSALLSTLTAARTGLVLDIGQTSLKRSVDGVRTRFPRPFEEVPLELHAREPARAPAYRARTLAFFASALVLELAPAALVLGLPCEIEDDLTVAGCSYPWQAGDPTLIRDLLELTGLADLPCLVLNDAELAAVSVQLTRDPKVATLVLTVGLGLGAAYLRQAERPSSR